MVRYLSTLNFTVQGIQDVQNSVARAGQFRAEVEKAGGKVLFQFWSLGKNDGCFVFEAPSEEVATKLLIQLEQQGNIRTKTTRVFDESEFGSITA